MSAADTLEFRIEPIRGRASRVLRVLSLVLAVATYSERPVVDDALVVRRASGHPVLRGPVEPGLRRFLKRAIEGDLARMSEPDFLRAWAPPGDWSERYKRWQERGWVPPVR